VPVDPVIDGLVERLVKLPVRAGRDERSVLRAEIGAGDEDGSHALPDDFMDLRQVLQPDLALALEDPVHVVAP